MYVSETGHLLYAPEQLEVLEMTFTEKPQPLPQPTRVFRYLSNYLYALLVAIPYLDPKKGAARLEKPLRVMRIATMAFTALVLGGIVLKAVGYPIDIILTSNLAVILLFLILGNLMAKFPPNYFAGIRTPWTLESPEVWRRVHQMASKLWVAGSLVLLLFVFRLDTPDYTIFSIVVILTLVAVPTVHSYLLYQKLRSNDGID